MKSELEEKTVSEGEIIVRVVVILAVIFSSILSMMRYFL